MVPTNIMSSQPSSAECVALSFNQWLVSQQTRHTAASKSASLAIESRFLQPVDSAALRLVTIWVDAVSRTANDPGMDVKSMLIKEDIHKLIVYLHQNNSSYYDVSLFDKAWAYYKTEAGRMGKWRFDACRSSEPTCVSDFFQSVTLDNMFDAFENLVGDRGESPQFWQSEYRIFWLLRERCGIDVDTRALDPISAKARTSSSIGQRTAIEDAARGDDTWSNEIAHLASDFSLFVVDMKKIAMSTHLARLQINISNRFIEMLEQFIAKNTSSMSDHVMAYNTHRDIGIPTSHSLVLARVKTALTRLASFCVVLDRRVDDVAVYIERAVASIVPPVVKMADVSLAYAKVLQEYELAAHSSHLLTHSRASLEQLDTLINGLFPVPTGLSDEFSSVLEKTIQLHTSVASLHGIIIDRIDAASMTSTLEAAKANYEKHRVTLYEEAIVVDVDSFMTDVYSVIQSRITANESLRSIRVFIETRLTYIVRADYTLEQQHLKATTNLKTFDNDAIGFLQLALTSNADIVDAKAKLTSQAADVMSLWSSALSKWTGEYKRTPPVYVCPSSNKKVIASWTMSDDAVKTLQHCVLSKAVQSYVAEFTGLYTELAASGDADSPAMRIFGLQAAIMSDTLGVKRSTHGLTFGQIVRGIEIVILTMIQTQVIVEASKTIIDYSPSSDGTMDDSTNEL